MNHVKLSNGERIERKLFDSRVKAAKSKKKQAQKDEHGYNFCVRCGKNDRSDWIDPAHSYSVDKCIKNGCAELAYDLNNLEMLCRSDCHSVQDGLRPRFND